MERTPAILLIGPTGAGKTPLGEAIAAFGLGEKRSPHFDFGARLRLIDQDGCHWLDSAEKGVVSQVLRGGVLLEDENFPIALKILDQFRAEKKLYPDDPVVLNGLPRHLGQARDLDRQIDIRLVVNLNCPADVVQERIRLDSGGDRSVRGDDSLPEIAAKLKIFRERTIPLLRHYREAGASILEIAVDVPTGPAEILPLIKWPI
jgi:adenylate kinase